MKNLFNKILNLSVKFCSQKNSKKYIYFISFIESIFFPIPTDIFLFPYILANKNRYLQITFYVSFFSVVGGLVSYFVGYFVWNKIYPILFEIIPGFVTKLNHFNEQFYEIGILLVIIGGFSPFPYKITCIGSGIVGINVFQFIVFSFFSRFLRFFLVSYFVFKYGEATKNIIGKYINIISLILVIILLIYFFEFL